MNEHLDCSDSCADVKQNLMQLKRGGKLDRWLYWYAKEEDDSRASTMCDLIGDIPLCVFVFLLITAYSVYFGFIFSVLYILFCVVGLFFGIRPDKSLWRTCLLPVYDMSFPGIEYYHFWPKLPGVQNVHLAHLPFLPIVYVVYGVAWFYAPVLTVIIHGVLLCFGMLMWLKVLRGGFICFFKNFLSRVKHFICCRIEWVSAESAEDSFHNTPPLKPSKENVEMKLVARVEKFELLDRLYLLEMLDSVCEFITKIGKDKIINVSVSFMDLRAHFFVWYWDEVTDFEEQKRKELESMYAELRPEPLDG